ncbi:MAG: HAD-IC family P-type ATPase, partial [Solirubrobacteraceae bacterium]
MLTEAERPHWLGRFARNFTYFFALLLWAGAALAWIGDQPQLSVAIVVVIVVNAMFSFAQEYRAERAVEALRRILPQRVRVRRDGRPREIDAEEVVPGDVLLLAAGDRVSADGELVADVELKVDMSTLTGESRPVRRRRIDVVGVRGGVGAPHLLFAGTYVVAGAAEARVTATGMSTELGRIAELTQAAERRPS